LLRVPIEKGMEAFEVDNIHIFSYQVANVYCTLLCVAIEKASIS
jgi:hypothetical protein